MSYATYDFTESLNLVPIAASDIAAVEAAWGSGDGMGTEAGHYKWAEDSATDWSGGFLLRLKDGTYAYVTGWCDYNGWGCQDGAEVHHYDSKPELSSLPPVSEYGCSVPPAEEWDIEPADLNRWLSTAATENV